MAAATLRPDVEAAQNERLAIVRQAMSSLAGAETRLFYPGTIAGIVNSDDFKDRSLGLAWQWNHNPVATGWSLTERPGWLRLRGWNWIHVNNLRIVTFA